jgi:predicted ester cyclase
MHRPRLPLILLCATASLSACKKKSEPAADQAPVPVPADAAPADVAPVEPVDRYLACVAAFNARSEDELANCYTADATVQLVDSGEPVVGGKAVLEGNLAFWKAMPDIRQVPQIVIATDARVAALLIGYGTHTGPLSTPAGELPPTQSAAGSISVELAAFDESGRITEATQFSDIGLLVRQLQKDASARAAITEAAAKPRLLRSAASPDEQARIDAVRAALAAVAAGKLDGASFDEQSTVTATALAADLVGFEAIDAAALALRKAFPDLAFAVTDAVAADDTVIATVMVTGTLRAPLGTLLPKATKKPLSLSAAVVVTFDGDLVRHAWVVTNGVALMTQLAP